MAWRGAGAVVALAIIGAGGGYAAGRSMHEPADTSGVAVPLSATNPTTPSDPKVRVLPDPAVPALLPEIPLRDVLLGDKRTGVRLSVPKGWNRAYLPGVESTWAVIDNPLNTYVLRVEVVASNHQSITNTKTARISALKAATVDFKIENQTADSFIATYVKDEYRRLTFHRWVTFQDPDPGDGRGEAYVEIAVTGRLADRLGLQDLIDRTTGSMRLAETVP